MIEEHDAAINALDFKSDIPFVFDKICSEKNIYVLHPYNFGWAGSLTVVDPNGKPLESLSDKPLGFELKVAEYVLGFQAFWMQPQEWQGGQAISKRGRCNSSSSVVCCFMDYSRFVYASSV